MRKCRLRYRRAQLALSSVVKSSRRACRPRALLFNTSSYSRRCLRGRRCAFHFFLRLRDGVRHHAKIDRLVFRQIEPLHDPLILSPPKTARDRRRARGKIAMSRDPCLPARPRTGCRCAVLRGDRAITCKPPSARTFPLPLDPAGCAKKDIDAASGNIRCHRHGRPAACR